MSHPAEDLRQHEPGDSPPPPEPAPVPDWLEARIVAVFAAVMATWLLIGAWRIFNQLTR